MGSVSARRRFPVRAPHAPDWNQRARTSRTLHRAGEVMAHSATGISAATLVLVWLGIGVAIRFPSWWSTTLYSFTASTTFVMVFVIQHTQARQTLATQKKLDELIRTSAHADDSLIALEEAPEAELQAIADSAMASRPSGS